MAESREALEAKLASAKSTWSSLRTEAQTLRAEIDAIDRRRAMAEKRLEQIVGGGWSRQTPGIKLAEDEVAEAERLLADCDLPAVVWSRSDSYQTREDWVVAKRDAKSISVRPRGSLENCERYRIDGTPVDARRKWRIDMEETK